MILGIVHFSSYYLGLHIKADAKRKSCFLPSLPWQIFPNVASSHLNVTHVSDDDTAIQNIATAPKTLQMALATHALIDKEQLSRQKKKKKLWRTNNMSKDNRD